MLHGGSGPAPKTRIRTVGVEMEMYVSAIPSLSVPDLKSRPERHVNGEGELERGDETPEGHLGQPVEQWATRTI